MCDGEGGHRLHQRPGVPDDQEQAKHEQQVIGARQDVQDAFDDVGPHHFPPRLRRGDLDPRLRRARDSLHRPAVQELDTDERVGDRELKPRDLDALAGEPFRPGVDPAALDERVGELLDHGRLQRSRTPAGSFSTSGSRMPASTGVRQSTEYWPGRRLLDLEIRRPRLVRLRRG